MAVGRRQAGGPSSPSTVCLSASLRTLGRAWASSGSLRTCPLDLLRRRVEVTESLSEVKGRLVFGPTKTYLTPDSAVLTQAADT